jgi:hypothetical protein
MYTEIKDGKRKYIGSKPKDISEFTKIFLHIVEKEIGFISHNQCHFEKNGLIFSASFGSEVILAFRDAVLLKIEHIDKGEVVQIDRASRTEARFVVSFKNYSIFDFILGLLRRSWEDEDYKQQIGSYITRVNMF